MGIDSLAPLAPAKVRALVLPAGRIHRDRFAAFLQRLNAEHVVHLRDISPDGRPNRTMFSPLAFPDGAMFYDLTTHVPPPSHLALVPFDYYREPLVLIAVADGKELESTEFVKRQSATSNAPTMVERNIRALYQELETLRDTYPRVLVHHVLIFDLVLPPAQEIPVPEGIKIIPPVEASTRTTMKTVMCDVSSLLLAEMTTLAKSIEAKSTIDSPGHLARTGMNGSAYTTEDTGASPVGKLQSQLTGTTLGRSSSTNSTPDRSQVRMSMPVGGLGGLKFPPLGPRSSSPPATPSRSKLASGLTIFDSLTGSGANDMDVFAPGPRPSSTIGIPDESKGRNSQDRVTVQGFGSGGFNDKWRNMGRGRVTILIGSFYLQAGRWTDALKELTRGASAAKSINDHLWHGKALDLIVVCLILLGWANIEFQVPAVCLNTNEKSISTVTKTILPEGEDSSQPRHLQNFQAVLPELLEKIVGHYTRVTGEQLPPLPISETIIRFCQILGTLHLYQGRFDANAFEDIVFGNPAAMRLTTSPRLTITPSRAFITNLLFKAFPASTPELLTNVDRALILSGIASVLGMLGFERKKAMVLRELVSVLIGGLIEARTRGAADVGIHPAAGLAALNAISRQGNGSAALDLAEGDIEHGIDAFLGILCKIYGVVGFESSSDPSNPQASPDDSDDKIKQRIESQHASRHFGFRHVKMNILRACIHFSEALPDFNGVLRYSSDLLRTAGSGIAPGPRRENAAPFISREEQTKLTTNITKTEELSKRLGLDHLVAEYWDEFLIRGITLDPLPATKVPIPHSRSVLPGVATARTSQDVNPFIYNPFLKAPDKAARTLVADEPATFRITIQNPYEVELDIASITLDTKGAEFESVATSTVVGPYRTQILKLIGTPKSAGSVTVVGAIVRVRGCRERRFPIFSSAWAPNLEIKVKGIGLAALKQTAALPSPGPALKCDGIELSAIAAQPVIAVKATSLSQSAIMILEGERKIFTVTLQNLSATTPADLLLFSFQDSTQGPLQTAIGNRDATPAELYEYELVLSRKQALRLRKVDDSKRFIAPGSTETFEFEILGKPGLTSAVIQVDYAYLGVPQEEVTEQFHTRQVCVDLTVTVNASVELARLDILPIEGSVTIPSWGSSSRSDSRSMTTLSGEMNCLMLMDFRNAWPNDIEVRLEAEEGGDALLAEHILPGNTNRVIFPIPRVYLDDPHAPIPSLNPSRKRQFVVSTSKITPETERANREAFWYREKILDSLRGTWKTMSGPARSGVVELRGLRLAPRMIDVVKVDEIGIDVSVESLGQGDGDSSSSSSSSPGRVLVDEFLQVRVRISNRTDKPVYPLVRLLPSLRHRPTNVALDFTRKFAWNGTLQQAMPLLKPKATADFLIGATALCRGEFEIAASVEETQLWTEPEAEEDQKEQKTGNKTKNDTLATATPGKDDNGNTQQQQRTRPRAGTEMMMADILGGVNKERRIWHSRQPCFITVCDEE